MIAAPFVPDGVWIPKAIIAIRSRYAVPLYLELRKHCFETPTCFPGVRRLARLVGCAVGTVSALTDEFHRLGIVTKLHSGRHCVYRFAQGCWQRRKSRKTAHCSMRRTEDKNNYVVPVDKREGRKNNRVSLDTSQQPQTRNKRVSMIVGLRRWCELSPALPDAERSHRLQMLDRAAAALDDWRGRPAEDRRCFELLVTRARAMPLEPACVQSLAQRTVGMTAIGALLPVLGRMPAKATMGSLGARLLCPGEEASHTGRRPPPSGGPGLEGGEHAAFSQEPASAARLAERADRPPDCTVGRL
jgi:hypothetical protein